MGNKITTEDLRCVICGNKLVEINNEKLFCTTNECYRHANPYNYFQNKPVIIDFNKSLISENSFSLMQGNSSVKRTRIGLMTNIRNFFRKKNPIVIHNVDYLLNEMLKISFPKILIIGGGEIGNGLDVFYKNLSNNITSFDIYNTPNIDFIADAHQIPITNDCFDLVIIQAVLEHVLDPKVVVNEIWRVLKFDGIVYAETPFMQQVHEGQFDFTRFSESGHRYLFKNFKIIKSGHILGAATSLLWSIDYFFSGLFRSRFIGKCIRFFFFWIAYLDRIIPDSFNIDAASGVYFIGRKTSNCLDAKEIIAHYKGNQK